MVLVAYFLSALSCSPSVSSQVGDYHRHRPFSIAESGYLLTKVAIFQRLRREIADGGGERGGAATGDRDAGAAV